MRLSIHAFLAVGVVVGAMASVAAAQAVALDASYTITRSTGGTFTSISTTGTALTNPATGVFDDTVFTVTLAAPFTFYGQTYTTVFASTNGLLTFGNGTLAFTNTPLPIAGAYPAVAVYWDDLLFFAAPNTGALYSQVSGTLTTIEWSQVGYFNQAATNTLTFQVILNSATGGIIMKYPDTSGPTGFSNGASATIGVSGTTTAAQVACNISGSVVSGNTLTVTLVGGSCCDVAQGCTVTAPTACLAGNIFTLGGVCTPNPCPPAGACCNGRVCTTRLASTCTGSFIGAGSSCTPPTSRGPINACCPADFNNSGNTEIQDIFDFLAAWFAGCW